MGYGERISSLRESNVPYEGLHEDRVLCQTILSRTDLVAKLAFSGFNQVHLQTKKPALAVFSLADFIGANFKGCGYNLGAFSIIDNIYSITWVERVVEEIYQDKIRKKGEPKDEMCPPWNM